MAGRCSSNRYMFTLVDCPGISIQRVFTSPGGQINWDRLLPTAPKSVLSCLSPERHAALRLGSYQDWDTTWACCKSDEAPNGQVANLWCWGPRTSGAYLTWAGLLVCLKWLASRGMTRHAELNLKGSDKLRRRKRMFRYTWEFNIRGPTWHTITWEHRCSKSHGYRRDT